MQKGTSWEKVILLQNVHTHAGLDNEEPRCGEKEATSPISLMELGRSIWWRKRLFRLVNSGSNERLLIINKNNVFYLFFRIEIIKFCYRHNYFFQMIIISLWIGVNSRLPSNMFYLCSKTNCCSLKQAWLVCDHYPSKVNLRQGLRQFVKQSSLMLHFVFCFDYK